MANESPSLMDVLEWSRTISLFIANYRPLSIPDNSTEASKAFKALQKLAELARLALPLPTEAQVRWGVLNDPYCHAAYAYGRQHQQIEDDRI